MRLPIDRRPQGKEKREARQLATSQAGFAATTPLLIWLVRTSSTSTNCQFTKHVTVHHRKFHVVILDFPTNIDILGEADFHKRAIQVSCVHETLTYAVSHYSDILFCTLSSAQHANATSRERPRKDLRVASLDDIS